MLAVGRLAPVVASQGAAFLHSRPVALSLVSCRRYCTLSGLARVHASDKPFWPLSTPLVAHPTAWLDTRSFYRGFASGTTQAEELFEHISAEDAIDQFIEAVEHADKGWWPLYVRGEVPDYPPRREMFQQLTAAGVDVERLEAFEVEDFTRWCLMRKKYGPAYPRMPYDVTLEQKIEEVRRRCPLVAAKSDGLSGDI